MSTFWSFCVFLTLISLAHAQQINGDSCQLPIDPGNCGVMSMLSSPTLRYGFDRTNTRCIQFRYSGCGGNTNRYTTYIQCVVNCFPPEVSFNDFLDIAAVVLTSQSTTNSFTG